MDPSEQATTDGADAPAMTCYRHPKREATIRCTRCDRPICTDCMNPAAVGFQCPDCVAEGRRTVRQARTIAGGRPSGDPMRLTIALIAVFVVAFIAQQVAPELTARFGGLVSNARVRPTAGIAAGEYYRLVTPGLLHNGVFHLGLNCYALYFTGPRVETALGRVRFVAVYLLAEFGGGVLAYLLNGPGYSSVGASGAIFGLFGAMYVLAKRMRIDTGPITGLLVINLVIGFVFPRIGWEGHVGGLIVGAALTAAYAYAPKDRRTLVQVGATVLVVAILVAATVIRTAMLTG